MGMAVPPGDVAADRATLLFAGGLVGAVEREGGRRRRSCTVGALCDDLFCVERLAPERRAKVDAPSIEDKTRVSETPGFGKGRRRPPLEQPRARTERFAGK